MNEILDSAVRATNNAIPKGYIREAMNVFDPEGEKFSLYLKPPITKPFFATFTIRGMCDGNLYGVGSSKDKQVFEVADRREHYHEIADETTNAFSLFSQVQHIEMLRIVNDDNVYLLIALAENELFVESEALKLMARTVIG